MKFTRSQMKAIDHAEGNLQLIACAGSGKTEVVARRIARLLKDGSAPSSVVAFTFTDRAASELKARIHQRCQEELGHLRGLAEMYIGTLHGFCLEMLKAEVPHFSKYELLNEVQQQLFVNRNSTRSGLTKCQQLDGRQLQRYIDTRRYIAALNLLRESRINEDALEGCSIMEGLESYRELLTSTSYFDYSSILEAAATVFESNRRVRVRLRSRLRHVVVDEYQDLNPVQERIVSALHGLGASICVVGDDDQTIYQWRGSDIGGILRFASRYPQVEQVRLQENFRSSKGIVETARCFIEENAERLEKKMVEAGAQAYERGDLAALSFDSPEEEARYIARTIKALRGVAFRDKGQERGLSYSDFAVLLRSVSNNGQPIIDALREAGVPLVVMGMAKLFQTAEALAARELFYFLGGHGGSDETSLRDAWMAADVGVTKGGLTRAIAEAKRVRAALASDSDDERWSFYNLQRQFLAFLENMELREERVPGEGRGELIFYNLGKFSQVISDFEAIHFKSKPRSKYEEFAKFLQYDAESAYPEGWQDNQYANPDAVRIMTVHQAKGMQWPVVFLPALLRNRFPSARMGGPSVWHLIPRAGVAGSERFDTRIEDERRLFYVAMTRSQKFLFMTWAPIPEKGNRYTRCSMFWEAIRDSEFVTPEEPNFRQRRRLKPEPRSGITHVALSFSDLKYFFECPYQFKLRILYGFNAPLHEALGYGKSLHDALAEIHQRAVEGKKIDSGQVAELVATHLHLPYAYQSLRAQLELSAQRILSNYIQRNRALFDQIEFSEKKIELHLGEGVTVTGRIDLVRRLDTDETHIVDLKTSHRSQPEAVTETQLHIYAMGYEQLTGRAADFVEVYELEEGSRQSRQVNNALLKNVRRNIHRAADALRDALFEPTPSRSLCDACDYQRLCSAGCNPGPAKEPAPRAAPRAPSRSSGASRRRPRVRGRRGASA